MIRYNIKYFHPTKTGGTSVCKALGIAKDHSAMNLKLSRNNMFRFVTVRHPYTRVVSMFNFFSEWKRVSFNDFLEQLKELSLTNNKYLPQVKYFAINGEIKVNKILRFENLNNDFKDVFDIELPHLNKNKYKKTKLSQNNKNYIYQIYEQDFKLLGYER